MDRLPVPRRKTLQRMADDIHGLSDEVTLLLEIITDQAELRIRDLTAFLSVVDSAFGRAHPDGYLSYSHRPQDQLRITRLRQGSTKYEIAVLVLEYVQMWQTVVTYAVIICLPTIVSGRAAKNWAEAYRAAGEGRAAWKANSTQLSPREKSVVKEVIASDEMLRSLSEADRSRLARAVEHVLSMEDAQLARAGRFSREHVRAVVLRIAGGDPNS